MLKRRWKRRRTPSSTESEAVESLTDEGLVPPPDADESPNGYSADVPSPSNDALDRRPFAQRIAATIAERLDRQSLVIGIYGAWGEGKTTVLAYIQSTLRSESDLVLVPFNPWRYGDEDAMLRSFFATLAKEVGRKLTTDRERFGATLTKYGQALPSVKGPLGIGFDLGKSASGIGGILSTLELEALKRRLEEILESQRKRVVVFIDDIDRLDKREIQALFRLIKLSADFSYITYVLAFDPDVVAQALGEQYGQGNLDAGHNFLEKIVQVPLRLPRADDLALRQICYDRVNQALRSAEIELTETQAQHFDVQFGEGLAIRLKTPRMALRYGNALAFSLPIMKGEVEPVDFMLMEGVRVFYPHLYETIRDNRAVFLGTIMDGGVNVEAARESGRAVLNDGLQGLSQAERDAAFRLVKYLFPGSDAYGSNVGYGPDWLVSASRERRVCSDHHFARYFSYVVAKHDVSDTEIDRLLRIADGGRTDRVAEQLAQLVNEQNAARFVETLRRRRDQIAPGQAASLALAMAREGGRFPASQGIATFTSVAEGAAMLIGNLVKCQPTPEQRATLARQIIDTAEPLGFAALCLRWIISDRSARSEERIISPEIEYDIGSALAARIEAEATRGPLYRTMPGSVSLLFWVWKRWDSRAKTQAHIANHLRERPEDVIDLLRSFVGTVYSGGVALPGDVQRETYDSLVQYVDADVVLDALQWLFPADIQQPGDRSRDDEVPQDRRFARQFARIHRHMLERSPMSDATNDEAPP
jgi:hypothetical protein